MMESKEQEEEEEEELGGSVTYMLDIHQIVGESWSLRGRASLRNPLFQHRALKSLVCGVVGSTCQRFMRKEMDTDWNTAWSSFHVEVFEMSRIHVLFNVALRFLNSVGEVVESSEHPGLEDILKKVCDLHVLYTLSQEASHLLESEFATSQEIRWLREEVVILCRFFFVFHLYFVSPC